MFLGKSSLSPFGPPKSSHKGEGVGAGQFAASPYPLPPIAHVPRALPFTPEFSPLSICKTNREITGY